MVIFPPRPILRGVTTAIWGEELKSIALLLSSLAFGSYRSAGGRSIKALEIFWQLVSLPSQLS
jgi:hypothetical protein